MTRWLGLLLIAFSLCGCDGFLDFFAGGFADDGGGGSSDLTTANLTGNWTLNVDSATNTLADADFDSDDDDSIDETYRGTWNVQGTLPAGFLSSFGVSNTTTSIEIDDDIFTFVTPGADIEIDYEVRNFNTIRFSQLQVTPVDATVVIRHDGDIMTITDTSGTGTFAFEDTRDDISAYTLVVTATTFVFTITPALASDGRPGTITYEYTIRDDNTLTFTNTTNDDNFDVDASLTNSTDTLTLTFPDGRVGRFERDSQ